MNILYDPTCNEDERRHHLFQGDILVFSPRPAALVLAEFARGLIEAEFAPAHPRHAHAGLEVQKTVEILSRLKPGFIHHPETKARLQSLFLDLGCDPRQTYQDVPRLRVAYPADYLSSGIAYAHHPHRDTWYSAPPCQVNWWMPLYEFEAQQGMAFHTRYWNQAIENSSSLFNYYQWNGVGRKDAAQHVKTDTRVQPRALQELEAEPELRLVVPVGAIILFSGNHLHSTVRNETDAARWSIDFRTVNLNDLRDRRVAGVADSQCTGTSLRDFVRLEDLEPMPQDVVAMYDDTAFLDGVAVFGPGTARPSTPAGTLPEGEGTGA